MSKQLLKFTASWCAPCTQLKMVMNGMNLGVPVVDIDIDENIEMVDKYKVRGVPTLILVEGEDELKRNVGAMTRESLTEFVK